LSYEDEVGDLPMRIAAVGQYTRSEGPSAFEEWQAALARSDAADQELRAALRANLFNSDRTAFDALTARVLHLHAVTDERLVELVDALAHTNATSVRNAFEPEVRTATKSDR
jgi:hypothetical protein